MPAAVAPAALKFTPALEVRVESPAGQAGDTLDDVTVEVLRLPQRTKAAVGKLNQVGLDALPESNVVVYRFADTPIDIGGGRERQLRAAGHRQDQGRRRGRGHRARSRSTAAPPSAWTRPWPTSPTAARRPIDVTISDDFFGPVSDVQMKVGQHTRRPSPARAAPAASSTPPPWTSPPTCPPWRASRS